MGDGKFVFNKWYGDAGQVVTFDHAKEQARLQALADEYNKLAQLPVPCGLSMENLLFLMERPTISYLGGFLTEERIARLKTILNA